MVTSNDQTDEPQRAATPLQREARAEETLKKIAAGGDVGAESLALSNEFTDEFTARLRASLRKVFRRPSR